MPESVSRLKLPCVNVKTYGKPQSPASKKSKKYHDHSISSMGYSGKDRGSQRSNLRSPTLSAASAGSYVMVNKVCKNYPLMVRGYCFSADLMLFRFYEFDVILGMDC
ncbi:protease [Gossypium australe]|uniref:Protease n=1 Tax=Gossypium australe TaxID=47621 RepID=A0A5B6W6S5_9ROSI|nr:protease [Gossypium australe]